MERTLADDIVDMIFSLVPYEVPKALWLALFTDSGEIVGGNYSRINVSGQFSKSENGVTENMVQIVCPVPSVGWGTVTGVGIYDQETGGNLLLRANVENPFTAPPNTNIYFNPKTVRFGLTL